MRSCTYIYIYIYVYFFFFFFACALQRFVILLALLEIYSRHMGSEQSKTNCSKEINTEVENNKSKIKSNISIGLKSSVKKNSSIRKTSSSELDECSDNESFSLIVKHKTQNSNMKKGFINSTSNSKNGNNDLDWDTIIHIIDTDVIEGMVIIEDSNE
ncbi:hypothetical protein [Cryptosporidium hominis TU502]|nr:hypothetical protein [Cryptosporidium hominis TU502]